MSESSDRAEIQKIQKLLAGVDEIALPLASRAIAISLEAIKSIIKVYPPQPSRTRAKTFNTYVRGQGNYPKSAFVSNPKAPGGFSTKKGTKAFRMTSQQMDKRFKTNVEISEDMVDGSLDNDATYSGYVLGWKDGDPKQVGFHAETGWVSSDEAIEKAMPTIMQAFELAADEILKRLVA